MKAILQYLRKKVKEVQVINNTYPADTYKEAIEIMHKVCKVCNSPVDINSIEIKNLIPTDPIDLKHISDNAGYYYHLGCLMRKS